MCAGFPDAHNSIAMRTGTEKVANPDKSATLIELIQSLGKSVKEQSPLTPTQQKKVTLTLHAKAEGDFGG